MKQEHKLGLPGRIFRAVLDRGSKRFVIGILVFAFVLAGIGIFISAILEVILATLWVGLLIGSIGGYQFGLYDEERILDEVLGEHWFEDAAIAELKRKAEDSARWS